VTLRDRENKGPEPDGSSGAGSGDGRNRVLCQVCGRLLVPLKDGTHRYHGRGYRCEGSGYRAARWPVGQRLRHHAGSVWEVVEDRGGRWGSDYLLRRTADPVPEWIQERPVGSTMVTHGEYMHRHGWEAS
jgi:hypothetical protein